jgi:nucleotide-binding universal stress UspA family protein
MGRILVALDSSELAPTVLDTALRIARTYDDRLLLVRVVRIPAEVPTAVFTMSTESLLDVLKETAKRELAALAAVVPADRLEGTEVLVGVPWQVICDEAKERDCTLIVIGAHGYKTLERVVGTTAAKVVNHADRSVLVVR